MSLPKRSTIVGIGNIYVETNYLGLATGHADHLLVGKEYRAPKWETRLGGSVVNFTVQARKLGSAVGLIGKVGNDEAGKKLINLLAAADISAELIKTSEEPDVQTSVDTGLVFEDGANIQVVAGNANQKLALKDIDLNHKFFETVAAVYLGGFLKQTSLYQDYPLLLKQLTERKIRVFLDHGRIPVDATPAQFEALTAAMPYVEGYFPNQDELIGITGQTDLTQALNLALKMGPKFVVVKLGSAGCRIKTATEDITLPGHLVKAVSTVGAGDAFNAGFITQYLANETFKTAGEFANATAAIRVSENKNPSLAEVKAFLQSK